MNLAKAKALAADYKDVYSVEIVPTGDAKTAALDSQVVITETTASSPFIDKSWIKKGMTVINMALRGGSGCGFVQRCHRGRLLGSDHHL